MSTTTCGEGGACSPAAGRVHAVLNGEEDPAHACPALSLLWSTNPQLYTKQLEPRPLHSIATESIEPTCEAAGEGGRWLAVG